jgi:predicted tellurium resistance membrane protein TerC
VGQDMDIGQWIVALLALTGLEIILGIDNIIFLTILASRLPPSEQPLARRMGLIAALGTRLGLLFAVNWLMSLKQGLFTIPAFHPILEEAKEISTKDLILIAGGLFLVGKSVMEIHHKLEGDEDEVDGPKRTFASFWGVVGQIAVIDIIFSLDSVITAVGGLESDEFKRQNQLIEQRWQDHFLEDIPMPGTDHFTVVDVLIDTEHPLTHAAIALCRNSGAA